MITLLFSALLSVSAHATKQSTKDCGTALVHETLREFARPRPLVGLGQAVSVIDVLKKILPEKTYRAKIIERVGDEDKEWSVRPTAVDQLEIKHAVEDAEPAVTLIWKRHGQVVRSFDIKNVAFESPVKMDLHEETQEFYVEINAWQTKDCAGATLDLANYEVAFTYSGKGRLNQVNIFVYEGEGGPIPNRWMSHLSLTAE